MNVLKIKKRYLAGIALLIALFTGQFFTQTHTFTMTWDDPNPATAQVTKYFMYEKVADGAFEKVAEIDAGTLQFDETVSIGTGMHTYYVTAVSMIGLESDPSNELDIQTNKPLSLLNLRELVN